MNCPKCDAAMTEQLAGGETVDRCGGCGGLWFDLREHERAAESKEAVAQLDIGDAATGAMLDAKRDIQCPRCHVKLLAMTVPQQWHLHYESCPVCFGAFFDAGEFKDFASKSIGEQISNFFRGFVRAGKRHTPPGER